MAANRQVDAQRLLRVARYLIPILVVGTCVGAWYSDVIEDFFAARPQASDIAGSWMFDEAEFERLATQAALVAPEGRTRDGFRAAILAKGDGYHGAVFTFSPDGYSIKDAGGVQDFKATYQGFPPNSLAIRPEQGTPLAVLVEEGGKRIVISLPMAGIPLTRVE